MIIVEATFLTHLTTYCIFYIILPNFMGQYSENVRSIGLAVLEEYPRLKLLGI